jgi:hypothetical protein
MDLVVLVLFTALIGFLVYIITTKIPMPPGWAMTIQIVSLIILLLYLLRAFVGHLPNVIR